MAEYLQQSEITTWPGRCPTRPEISVLIPCWHGESTIGGALDSVEAQTGLPKDLAVEIVVVIDGRVEDLNAVSRWIEQRSDSRQWGMTMVVLPRNLGAGGARKAGYRYCSGTFLAFLDDDDVWHPRKLMIQWSWHREHPEQIGSGHGYASKRPEREVGLVRLLIGGYDLHTSTLMIQRSLWPYEPEPYRFSEDWLMLAMIATRQPIQSLPYDLSRRSSQAPAITSDPYSLCMQRRQLRLGKIKAMRQLVARRKLCWYWLPLLVSWDLLLAIRRWILDGLGSHP